MAGGETEGLVSGDAGTGVEGVAEDDGDAPDPETTVSVGIGSGGPAGGVEDEEGETGDAGAGDGLPKSVGEDAAGAAAGAPPHVLLC